MRLRLVAVVFCSFASIAARAADGDPDPGFAGGALATRAVTDPGLVVTPYAALAPDGSVLVATGEGDGSASGTKRFVVTRFGADGVADDGFGGSGVARIDFADFPATARALARTPSDHWIVAGSVGTAGDVGVARLRANGTLDETFGTYGRTRLAFGAGNNTLTGLAVDAQDRTWLLVGTVPSTSLVRLTADGVPDASFGNGGVLALGTPC